MTRNTWIIFAVLCVALIGGLIWTSRGNETSVEDVKVDTVQSASDANGNIADHTLGNPDAKVVIVEYSDFQCPGCAAAAPNLKSVAAKYEDDVLLIFRNFAFLGGNSRAAAAAAEAAGLQGKFWEMNEKLFIAQSEWKQSSIGSRVSIFSQYASQLGLDVQKFESDLASSAVEQKIDSDKAIGNKVGVTGTPSIFINGVAANTYVKDGKIVPKSTQDAQPAWASSENFEKFEVLPALKKAGVAVTE